RRGTPAAPRDFLAGCRRALPVATVRGPVVTSARHPEVAMSRRRRPQSTRSPAASSSTLFSLPPSLASPPPRATSVNLSNDDTDLPLSQSDNGGSVGNALTLLEQANALIAPRPNAQPQRDAKALRAEALAIRRSIA